MKTFILIAIILFASVGFAEERLYDYSGVGAIYNISCCDDGMLIPTRRDMHPGHSWSPFVLRIDSNGDTLWSFGSDPAIERDRYACGAELTNGEIILIQDSDWIFYMIKLSASGDSITSMELPDSIAGWAYDIAASSDSGFYLFCDCETLGTSCPRVIKYNSDFELEWLADPVGRPGPTRGAAKSGAVAPNGDIIAAIHSGYSFDAWIGIWCLDSLGNQKWLKGTYARFQSLDLSITPDGQYGLLYTAMYSTADLFSGFLYVVDADSHLVFSNQISVPFSPQNMVECLAGMPDNYWWVMGSSSPIRFFQLLSPSGIVVDLDTMHIYDPIRFWDIAYHPEMGFVKCGIQDSKIYLEWQKTLELQLLSPHGGELWFAGDMQNILWNSRNVDSVEIEYSTNNGVSWSTEVSAAPSTGSYDWILPDLYSTQCLLRIICRSDTTCRSQSEAVFTIDTASAGGENIDLISPSGDTIFIEQNTSILWNCVRVDSVNIEYSRDSGYTWESIVERYPADGCAYDWMVPPGYTNYGFIKIVDSFDSTIFDINDEALYVEYDWPWIEVICPSAWDSFSIGDTIDLSWTYGNFGAYTVADFFVFLTSNGGVEWENIHNTTDTSYRWIVPDIISDSCCIGVATTDSFAGDTLFRSRPMEEPNIYGISAFFSIYDSVSAIREYLPSNFSIRIMPNPFNSAVSISAPENTIVEIFDINGRMVAEIPANNPVGVGFTPARIDDAGKNERDGARPSPTEIIWRPDESVGSGIYLVRARFDDGEVTKRVIYLK